MIEPIWRSTSHVPSKPPWSSVEDLFERDGPEATSLIHEDDVCYYGNDPSLSSDFANIIGLRVKAGLRTSVLGAMCGHSFVSSIVASDKMRLTSFVVIVVASEHTKIELPLGSITCMIRNRFSVDTWVVDDGSWNQLRPDYDLCVRRSVKIISRQWIRDVISRPGGKS